MTCPGIPPEVAALDDAKFAIEKARREAAFDEYLAEELKRLHDSGVLSTLEETAAGLHEALMQPENLALLQRLRVAGARDEIELAAGFVALAAQRPLPPLKGCGRWRPRWSRSVW